jgi:hypothetical protein
MTLLRKNRRKNLKTFIYGLEWVITFLVIWLLFKGGIYLFRKKFNVITSAIFTFVVVGLLLFLTSHYFLSFPNPAYIYMPFMIFLLIINILKIKAI